MQALKIAYLSICSGDKQNAVCTASELPSATLLSKHYNLKYDLTKDLHKEPYLAFEKDFLRFMLSDGAGAVWLENKISELGVSLKIEWIEINSYADKLPTCMYMGAELLENGELKGWKEYTGEEIIKKHIFTVKQDVRTLSIQGMPVCVEHIASSIYKHKLNVEEIDYFLPHLSSMFFYNKLNNALQK